MKLLDISETDCFNCNTAILDKKISIQVYAKFIFIMCRFLSRDAVLAHSRRRASVRTSVCMSFRLSYTACVPRRFGYLQDNDIDLREIPPGSPQRGR